MNAILEKLQESDQKLIFLFMILLFLGLIMVYSSSGIVLADSLYYFKKQLVWAVMGLFAFVFFLMFDYNRLRKILIPLLSVSFILLVMLFFMGKEIGGAKRWLDIGPFNFQPSEIAKFCLVLFLADYLDKKKSKLDSFTGGLFPALCIVGVYCVLIAMQPDIGIPAIIVTVTFIMLFVAGARLLHLGGITILCLPVFVWGILAVPYRRARFFAFLDPWNSKNESAYQLMQSLLSIGSGGFAGKGLGQSEIKKFYLPGEHTDFIFSIIGEELGVIGAIFVLLAFTYFLYLGFKISKEAPDLFSKLLATGLTLSIVLQAYFNIAVCCGCLPTKGIPLPFISYGGSSLIITLSAVGILANIAGCKTNHYPKFYRV